MIPKTTIIGNLTRDPELTYSATGLAICKISIAVNEWRKDKDDYVSYFDVTIFDKRAEAFQKNHSKGDKACVYVKLRQDRWQDQNGQNRSKIVGIAEDWEFVSGEKKQESNY